MKPVIIAVSGVKNSGKSTFLEHMIPLLKASGLQIAVIKHDGHTFEPDVPGTDSWRLRHAGADGTAVYSGQHFMIIRQEPGDLDTLIDYFSDYDLILLEGQKNSDYPKIELVRGAVSTASVCRRETLLAIATDTDLELPGIPRLGLDDYEKAVRLILKKYSNCLR